MSFLKASVAALALAVCANAHMIMNTPPTYDARKVQTSPLNGDNFKFPCQLGTDASLYPQDKSTRVTAGSTTLVKFTGSAVHGSGVCAFAVTYQYPPPADPKQWKVIHTIIGGCPADAALNIPTAGTDKDGRPDGAQCGNSTGKECVRQFDIPLPKGMPNGKATFAWIWFNAIGNREMYMNCSPIEVSGGGSDSSALSALPSLFVANIPGKCSTAPGVLDYPNPGQSVLKNLPPTPGSLGTCSAADADNAGGSAPAPAPPSSGQTTTQAAVTTQKPAPTNNPGGVFAPGASSGVETKPTTVATVVVPTQSAAVPAPTAPSNPSPPSGSPPSNGGSGACDAGSIPCNNPGAMICASSNQWGTCDINNCAVLRPVAQGTMCSQGAIAAIVQKRSSRHLARHAARAHARFSL